MRFTKCNIAMITPILTATTRSANTVKPKVSSRIATSARGARLASCTKCGASLIFQATTNRIALNVARGIFTAKGASTSRIMTSVSACMTPAIGLLPPLRMLVAVRAIAPVAAIPPNRGATIFAIPCPTNSWFELCLVPAMPSATTAESKDSIAPNIAIAKAGPIS
ncbi:Uncharacterised protein [Vibrio cholerae]|nr:Uncharacterised protein [Vibrio cholerae]